jgi:hypothetical protein
MIVRKYCERKRARGSVFAKGKNKKDLMEEFRSEAAGGIGTNVGLSRSTVPTKLGPRDRYGGRYVGRGAERRKRGAAVKLQKLVAVPKASSLRRRHSRESNKDRRRKTS